MSNEAEERMIKARIKLQGKSPFFSYLSFFLKFKEQEKQIDECYSMGIYPDGTLVYNKKWVESLSEEEVIGVLCHEIMHLALLHLIRRRTREQTRFNIACDLGINAMLIKNGFKLPKDGILPYNDEWEIPKIWLMAQMIKQKKAKGVQPKIKSVITNIGQKTAEEIYEELPEVPDWMKSNARGRQMRDDGEGKGCNVGGWDKHNEENEGGQKKVGGKGKDGDEEDSGVGKALSEAEKNEIENEWLNRIEEAYVAAKQRGNVPLGLERYMDELKKSQLDWKTLLQKYMMALLPMDYTWAKRSKKSMALESYMPSVKKEKIDVCVGIDTSGSIGKEELTDFVSEMIGMAKAYKDRLSIRIMSHDVDVHTDHEVKNGNIDKIKKIQVKGGGGTSHRPIFDHIRDKVKDAKVFISFTDGYSDLESIKFRDYRFSKIFVLSKGGTDEWAKRQKGECIVLKIK